LPGIPGNGRAHSCSAHNTAQFLRLAHRKEGSKRTRTPGKAGVKVGDKLEVVRVTREIKNPATGAVIRPHSMSGGTVKATDVDDASAVCTSVFSSGFKVGDSAKSDAQSSTLSHPVPELTPSQA
jgi:hypothetical protein